MPFKNEHACRLRDPGDFQDGSFRSQTRDHEGKEYRAIMGRLKGQDSMTDQAFRYKKSSWSADQARSHCSGHNGTFEAAIDESAVNPLLPMFDDDEPAPQQATDDKRFSVSDLETLLQRGIEFLKTDAATPTHQSSAASAAGDASVGSGGTGAAQLPGPPAPGAPAVSTSQRDDETDRSSPVGQFASWNSHGVALRGRVEEVHRSGVVRMSERSPGLVATERSPVYMLRVYEEVEGGWKPTEKMVPRGQSQCTMIGDLRRPRGFVGLRVNQKDAETAEILIYADITPDGYGGVSAKQIDRELKRLKGQRQIDLRINSGGGDAFEGMAIHNLLANFQIRNNATINVYNDGLVASAATIIACAAKKVTAMQHSFYMVHRAWAMAIGNSNDMMKVVGLLNKIDDEAIAIYMAQTGQDKKKITKLVDEETWLTAQEAHELGFVNDVIETDSQVNVSLGATKPWYHNLPEALAQRLGPMDQRLAANLPSRLESRALAA